MSKPTFDPPAAPRTDGTCRALTVGDVMNRAVVSAYRGALFKEIVRALARNDIDTVPVVDEDHRVIGVVTASDLLARLAHPRVAPRGHRLSAHTETQRKRHAEFAHDLMTRPPVTTTPDTPIVEAARLAAKFRVRSLPVVDDRGTLVGMIARNDFVKLFLRDDEDIRAAVEEEVLPHASAGTDALRVQVEEGVVTVSGTVADQLTARAVLSCIARIPGVIDVHSHLKPARNDVFLPIGH